MVEFHSVKAFARDEPRVELIDALLKSVLRIVELEFEGHPVKVDGFRLRNLDDWRTVEEISPQENLGSFSTVCNCKCAFCYEDGNPEDLFEKRPRLVGIEEAVTRLRYLRDGRGLLRESKAFFEPFTNPDLLTLFELIREKDPHHVIDITTNGSLLTAEIISRLVDLRPVFVNLSLISADEPTRRAVMSDSRAGAAIRAIEQLSASRIPFMGTLVPLPEQGLDDIAKTIEYLDAQQARVIRLSMPGLTRHHPRYQPQVIEAWLPRLVDHVLALRADLRTPVMMSPYSYVSSSIEPVIEGVVANSPADLAGIRLGSVLISVDGKQVVSRTHAINLLQHAMQAGTVEVGVLRDGDRLNARLHEPGFDDDRYPYKPRGYRSLDFRGFSFGLCLPAGFHLQYLKQIHIAIQSRAARRTLLVVSRFFRGLVEDLLAELALPEGASVELVVPENVFFGGTVNIGDLWVVEDIERALRPYLEQGQRPDLILLPSSFLSRWGRDVLGVHYRELEARLGVEMALVKSERIVL